MCVCKTVK